MKKIENCRSYCPDDEQCVSVQEYKDMFVLQNFSIRDWLNNAKLHHSRFGYYQDEV